MQFNTLNKLKKIKSPLTDVLTCFSGGNG